jgi:hypothetical protein
MPHSAGVATAIHMRFREAIISHFGTLANRLIVRAEMGKMLLRRAFCCNKTEAVASKYLDTLKRGVWHTKYLVHARFRF